VGAHAILEREDRDGVHGQLVRGAEHTDGDFLTDFVQRAAFPA
jgi:hypothetical protein